MVACHPLQTNQRSSFWLPRRRGCRSRLLKLNLDRTSSSHRCYLANLVLRTAKVQMRTRYPIRLHLESNLLAHSHLARQLLLHRLARTKQGFDGPTKVGERCTNRACHLPIQSNVAPSQSEKSLLCRFEPHLLLLWQVVRLLQTTEVINVVRQLFDNVNNGQRYENMVASPSQVGRLYGALLLPHVLLQSDPFHRTLCRCLP